MFGKENGAWDVWDGTSRRRKALAALAAAAVVAGLAGTLATCGRTTDGTDPVYQAQAPAEGDAADGPGDEGSAPPPASEDSPAQDAPDDSKRVSGVTFQGYSLLGPLTSWDVENLASGVKAYAALRGLDSSVVTVTREAEESTSAVRAWIDAGAGEALFEWTGVWSITDSEGSLTINPAPSTVEDGAASPADADVDDADALSDLMPESAAKSLGGAFRSWAAEEGASFSDDSLRVVSSSARPSADGTTVLFTVTDGSSTWNGTYDLDAGTLTFAAAAE